MSNENDRESPAKKPERFSLRRETLRHLEVKSALRTGQGGCNNSGVCNGAGPSCNKSKVPTTHVYPQ